MTAVVGSTHIFQHCEQPCSPAAQVILIIPPQHQNIPEHPKIWALEDDVRIARGHFKGFHVKLAVTHGFFSSSLHDCGGAVLRCLNQDEPSIANDDEIVPALENESLGEG